MLEESSSSDKTIEENNDDGKDNCKAKYNLSDAERTIYSSN